MSISTFALGALSASIPSPPQGVWYLGPIPIRAYALAILTGIIVGLWVTCLLYTSDAADE